MKKWWTTEELDNIERALECQKTIEEIEMDIPTKTKKQILLKINHYRKGKYPITNNLWTKNEVLLLTELVKNGNRTADIQKRFPNKCVSNIYRKIRELKIFSPKNIFRPWTVEDEESLVKMFNDGLPRNKITKLLNRTSRAILNKYFELNLIEQPKWTYENEQKLIEMVNNFTPFKTIAQELKISLPFIQYKIDKLGIRKKRKDRNTETYIFQKKHNNNLECRMIMQKFLTMKTRAKAENLPFDITHDYLWTLYEKQEKKCFYTGILMQLSNTNAQKAFSVSVDKINPRLGYTKGNIVFCCNIVNTMKLTMLQKDFFDICRKILNHSSQKNEQIIEFII